MTRGSADACSGAVLVGVLVLIVLATALGGAMLTIVELELQVAENARRSAVAAHAARAGARAVTRWFDDPQGVRGIPVPRTDQLDRSRRKIDPDGEAGPLAARVARPEERYKQGVDRDGDGRDDLFDWPFEGTVRDGFHGTAEGPDVRVEDRGFLDRLSAVLFAGAGAAADHGDRPRLASIALWGPPTVPEAGRWRRRGLATIEVRVVVERRGRVVARRAERRIVEAIPYGSPRGPLHSCGDLTLRVSSAAEVPVVWGPAIAGGALRVEGALPAGLPRSAVGGRGDPVWGPDFVAPFDRWVEEAAALGDPVDPWFRLVAGGRLQGEPDVSQPRPSPWRDWVPGTSPPRSVFDHSHLLQRHPVPCPIYDYGLFKAVARSGASDTRYFRWVAGDRFVEETGIPVDPQAAGQSLESLTDGGVGLFFFDTTDGEPPRDDRSNFTPPLAIDGSRWSFRGLLWIHTRRLRLGEVIGRPLALVAPGEPFEDRDRDGRHDPSGEPWIGVDYRERPEAGPGPMRLVPPGPRRRIRAPLPVDVEVALGGLLVLSGDLVVEGRAVHAGAFVVGGDAEVGAVAPGGPRIVWDSRLGPGTRGWPPAGSGVPRVRVTQVITDP